MYFIHKKDKIFLVLSPRISFASLRAVSHVLKEPKCLKRREESSYLTPPTLVNVNGILLANEMFSGTATAGVMGKTELTATPVFLHKTLPWWSYEIFPYFDCYTQEHQTSEFSPTQRQEFQHHSFQKKLRVVNEEPSTTWCQKDLVPFLPLLLPGLTLGHHPSFSLRHHNCKWDSDSSKCSRLMFL